MKKTKKLDYVDALRGLAILGVIMVHTNQYGNITIDSYMINKIISFGAKGVQLFYLASAFTIFLSFKNRLTSEKSPIRNFFLRRFFRIAPMYYLGVIYYLFQDGLGPKYWLGDATHISILNIISNFTFLHGFNPYWITSIVPGGWSIGVEMTFYAIIPFLFSKIKNINHAFIFFIASIIFKLLLYLFFIQFHLIGFDRLWIEYLYLYFPSQLPAFSLGIILYFIVIEKEAIQNISGKALLVFSLLFLAQLTTGFQFIFSVHILFSIAFLFLALALSKFHFRVIVNPIVNFIGKISFSMYLVHFAVLHWLTYFNFVDYFDNGIINYITRYLIVIIITTIVSTITYKLIEIPFQEIGKKIIAKLEKNK